MAANFTVEHAPSCRLVYGDSKNKIFLTLGYESYIGGGFIENWGANQRILIAKYTSISWDISFSVGLNHDYRQVTIYPVQAFLRKDKLNPPPPKKSTPKDYIVNKNQAIIGNDVWIGHSVVIMGGVRIGNGAVIGTGSILTRNVPAYSIVVGAPARVIKYRFDTETIRKLQVIRWWNWSSEKILEEFSITTDPHEIVEKFYSPELEVVPRDEFGDDLRELKSRGFRIFSAIADFQSSEPLWKKIIEDFLNSDLRYSILCMHISKDTAEEYLDQLRNLTNMQSDDKVILIIKSHDQNPFSLDSLRQTDVFITTREDDCSKAIDALSDIQFDCRYIFDDLVFY